MNGSRMTLGEATEVLASTWACACVGRPPGAPLNSPCYCQLAVAEAEQLRRAAHIVARLLADAGRGRP